MADIWWLKWAPTKVGNFKALGEKFQGTWWNPGCHRFPQFTFKLNPPQELGFCAFHLEWILGFFSDCMYMWVFQPSHFGWVGHNHLWAEHESWTSFQDILLHDSTHLLWCYDTPSKVSFNQVNIFASASQAINHAHVELAFWLFVLMWHTCTCSAMRSTCVKNIYGIISE